VVILCGSYFFYMSWRPEFGLLLFGTTLVDWYLALVMARQQTPLRKKLVLALAVAANISVLFFFKYFDFATSSLWSLFGYSDPLVLNILLPIGISFYTFQSIAYMVDVYRKDLQPERNFFRYATFVSFFPHLVAGPILRPANILPQIRQHKEWSAENLKIGLFYIATGLIKKVVIADRLGVFVDQVYLQPELYSGATLLAATYLFAFQIYCDFSGYTDIAIGSARILGYTIPDNFRQPYFSQSLTEFWRRWHISLSSWLRDYLYIPLGGNRKGTVRTYANLLITMFLGGLWHGAAWTFVIWGLLHGLYLAAERFIAKLAGADAGARSKSYWAAALRVLVAFNLVSFAWIFFRADSLDDALYIIKSIFGHFGTLYSPTIPLTSLALYGILILVLLAFDYWQGHERAAEKFAALKWYWRWPLAYAAIFGLIFFAAQSGAQFIYFQF